MTEPDINELKRVAEGATPGPWEANAPWPIGWIAAPSEKGGSFHLAEIRGWGYFTGGGSGALGLSADEGMSRQAANATHIATFDPPTVLALLARLERAEAALRQSQHYLNIFLGGDDRFQVAVGGNPNAIEKMLNEARAAASYFTATSVPQDGGGT